MNLRCGYAASARPRRRAAAMVEFAVIAPIFFLIVLGVVELARAFMIVHQLTDAARNGCRTAIISGKSDNDVKAKVNAYLTNVNVSGYTTKIYVNGTEANASTAVAGDKMTVLVTVPTTSISWVPGAKYLKGNLNGRYTMRRE